MPQFESIESAKASDASDDGHESLPLGLVLTALTAGFWIWIVLSQSHLQQQQGLAASRAQQAWVGAHAQRRAFVDELPLCEEPGFLQDTLSTSCELDLASKHAITPAQLQQMNRAMDEAIQDVPVPWIVR